MSTLEERAREFTLDCLSIPLPNEAVVQSIVDDLTTFAKAERELALESIQKERGCQQAGYEAAPDASTKTRHGYVVTVLDRIVRALKDGGSNGE